MKQFMLRNLMLFSLLCSTWGVGSAWAQLTSLEVGKVYHFTNAMHTNYAIGVNSSEEVRGITPVNKADYNQLWRVAEKDASGNYRLQSVGHGGYLQAKGQEAEWLLVDKTITTDTYLVLGVDESNSYNVFRGVNYNGGKGWANLNINSRNVIWGWSYSGDNASKWTIEKVELDEAALNKALDNQVLVNSTIREAVTTALSNLFTDVACTTAKKSLTVAALESDADYQALTPTLQKMAKKVYGSAWEEKNYDANKSAWENDYAKKYRVQWYEPYTEPECAASALRINAHTNLNNPTGIFANSGDVLFLMVEGEIKEGAYLYLAKYTGHGKLSGYKDGVQLHSGLNIVPVTEDGANFCINYVVQTFDTSKGTGKKAIIEGRELSNYPDLQIHIEGGYINGYWNKMGDNADHNGDFNYPADKDADWDYIKARATQIDATVLGEYVTLQFPLTDAGTGDDKGMGTFFNSYGGNTTSLETSIEEWDNVMIWERLLMGVVGQSTIDAEDKKSPYSDEPTVTAYTGDDGDDFGCDYSEYYRVHGLSFGTEGGYMYGSWDHCGYNFNTMESIMLSIVNEAGPHWGPAHEIGHQHQGPLNMRGLTEVTNNLFSNVVLWYYGKSTARYNGTDGALTNVLQQFNAEDTDFFSNNIWAQTVMYYKLFLYYHVLG
ncbi:MAG: M60 family metallopeptidase, partial [Bacteroidaceae bacterium]|nr:M60 family metallopeptidase [Bacteroidaceae bacterium]